MSSSKDIICRWIRWIGWFRVLLESPEGHKLNCVVQFNFKTSNNAAEYEALLAGLRLAKEMQLKNLAVRSDSQLVIS